jgi:radical SAM-linked protein
VLSETLRIRFAKRGRLKFISHLDLCRTMQSAMIRARLPLWYTEGFNPHPRISVALPLSVGAESECELLDVKVTQIPDTDEVARSLNAATAPELEIIEAYKPETKFSEIGSSEYKLFLELPYSGDFDALFAGAVIVPKRTKKGEVDTDIKPLINSIKFEFADAGTLCRAVLAAYSESYLNPEYIIRAIERSRGVEQNSFEYSICRMNIFDKTGNTFR